MSCNKLEASKQVYAAAMRGDAAWHMPEVATSSVTSALD